MPTPREREAGQQDPDCLRGAAALARGDLDGAARAYRKAIRRGTKNPDAYNNLGVIMAQRGDLDAAIPLFEVVLSRAPDRADAGQNLFHAYALRGLERYRAGILEGAAEDLRASLELNPASAQTASDLGAVLSAAGRFLEAVECCRRAVDLAPDFAPAHTNLGSALLAVGRVDDAATTLQRAVALAPDDPKPAINLAAVEQKRGNLSRAEAMARHALALSPSSAGAHHNLSLALLQQGELQGTLHHSRQAVTLVPDRPEYHSGLLLALNYDPAVTPEALAAEHRRFHAVFGAATPPAARSRSRREPTRRLRVGYVSPDLRGHSVAFFFEPLLRAHDRAVVEITCYADSMLSDGFTERIRAEAEHWRAVAGSSDIALAELVDRDEVDVLVDLAGHTGHNRMSLFARRAAPAQFTYLGYPATTGLATMDYRVTDDIADPVGATEALHAERLVRLEGGFLCYSPPLPPGDGPGVAPPPCIRRGDVTFGSFNTLIKVNDLVLDAWATLLHRVPGARLLLKARAFSEEQVRQRIWLQLEALGIARERVELAPPALNLGTHLATYERMDIALDTFPYNGTTTTCEALWMGVPVVTFAGSAHAGRVGASILSRIGLEELAPATLEQSIAAAVRLVEDRDRLVELRQTMRDRMLSSPLMDAARLARQLEAAYQGAL